MRAPASPAVTRLSIAGLIILAAACAGAKRADATDSADLANAAANTPATTTAPAARADTGMSGVTRGGPVGAPMHPGDVAITTPKNGITLALAGDSIWMGLSDSVRTMARAATDSARIKAEAAKGVGGAFGAMIAKTVTAAVNSGLAMRVAYPVSDIQDVRYADGAIQFTYRPGAKKSISFEDVNTENGDGTVKEKRPVLATFAPADAQRFVAAVRARSGGRMTFPPKPAAKP